jgi:AmmeMemoRadiSam system protein A
MEKVEIFKPVYRTLLLLSFLGILAAALGSAPAYVGREQNMQLSEQDKIKLHEIARQSIAAGLAGKKTPPLKDLSGVLKEPRGAFVTLHLYESLRGCIGLIEAVKPLGETIQEMAYAAAFGDPRFPPLTAREFPDIALEISVLSPLKQTKNIDEIQVGVHGLYIRQGSCRGLLLPQVATEHKWDRETFLQQTCHKAGLPAMAWKDPKTEIYLFSADIF